MNGVLIKIQVIQILFSFFVGIFDKIAGVKHWKKGAILMLSMKLLLHGLEFYILHKNKLSKKNVMNYELKASEKEARTEKNRSP